MNDQTILPVGFYDLYGAKAEKHYSIMNNILSFLLKNNFDLFIPTALEFSHDSTNKSHNNNNTKPFSVHDPLSENMLNIRDDITPQINRALNYSTPKQARICYFGDIYRANISSSEQKRKFTQVGFEIIEDNLELIIKDSFSQLLAILEDIALTDYKIIISLPAIFEHLANELEITGDNYEEFKQIINEVNLSNLSEKYKLNETYKDLLIGLELNQGLIAKLNSEIPHDLLKPLAIILDIISNHQGNIAEQTICNFRYDSFHSNIAFTLISPHSNATFARGGDYQINNRKGCGTSFYIEEILNSNIKTPLPWANKKL